MSITSRVVVIGAGVAGVNAARALSQVDGVTFTVFDKSDRIGGHWCSGYKGYGLQTPKHMYHFPDEPWPKDTPQFPTGEQVQRYIEKYVDKLGLRRHFRLDTAVKLVTRKTVNSANGEKATTTVTWNVILESGEVVECDYVIVASGFYGIPSRPKFSGLDEKFRGKVLHSSEFSSPDLVEGRKVVTIGGGKSAIDVAKYSKTNGAASSVIVVRRAHWFVPQKIANLVPFDWATFNRFGGLLFHPYHKPSTAAQLMHVIGWPLKWIIWRLVEVILTIQQGIHALGIRPAVRLDIDCFGPGGLETHPSFFKMAHCGDVGVHACRFVREFTENAVILDNGESIEADVVFLATGYDPAPIGKMFPGEKLQIEKDGIYLYRHIVSPDLPNVFFVGALSNTFSNILLGAVQSLWICGLLRGSHSLPDADVMRKEIERVKGWKRSWMPESSARAGHIQLHQIHYYDELIQDFNGTWKRKNNLISEFFGPYHPKDYASLVCNKG